MSGILHRAGKTPKLPEREPVDPSVYAGFVYILYCEFGCYKIGESKNPERRFKQLAKKYKFQWSVVCVLPSKACWRMEGDLHRKYHALRVKGMKDWFRLTEADIEEIKAVVK